MEYHTQQLLPPTPPPSPPTKHVVPSTSPAQQFGHAVQLRKGLRKKKAKKRKPSGAGIGEAEGTEAPATHDTVAAPSRLCPPCDLDISDLCLDSPPCPRLCQVIRYLMVQDLLAASRACSPCRDINLYVPLLPTDQVCRTKRRGSLDSSSEAMRRDLWRAELEKQKLLMLHEGQKPRLGAEHGTCPIGKCGIKRCLMWDSLMDVDVHDVTVKMHIQPSLLRDLALPPFTLSLKLHVHVDDITGSSFVCAPELVRAILPRFFGCFEKKMHSLYTLNHPFGRGMPQSEEDQDNVLESDAWRKWAGCPQALQGRKCNPDESKTRIWLLDDGTAEVSLGAECEPDENTIAPPINSSKGKSRAS
ncbi:hypothetical protein NliqN6_1273 [Naganishia liquefaciens]|uniref:Uncharacterized protein n=1 Tax=Naganishia liquefaciens TaxID=104408 RepID=A0A8H3TPB9_9TREE|nr:hypothetical protein NliqN6_1273 [Naganishia liquefaciens]